MSFDPALYLEVPAYCPECDSDKWHYTDTIFADSNVHIKVVECRNCGFSLDEVWVLLDAIEHGEDFREPEFVRPQEVLNKIYELMDEHPIANSFEHDARHAYPDRQKELIDWLVEKGAVRQ